MTLSSPKYQVLSKSLNHVIISRSRSVDNPDHLYLISRTVNETFHPAPVNSTMKLGDVSLSHGSDMALSECDIWADHQWFFSRYFGFLQCTMCLPVYVCVFMKMHLIPALEKVFVGLYICKALSVQLCNV